MTSFTVLISLSKVLEWHHLQVLGDLETRRGAKGHKEGWWQLERVRDLLAGTGRPAWLAALSLSEPQFPHSYREEVGMDQWHPWTNLFHDRLHLSAMSSLKTQGSGPCFRHWRVD